MKTFLFILLLIIGWSYTGAKLYEAQKAYRVTAEWYARMLNSKIEADCKE